MPATFPSHALAVLPVKLWRPAGFDGVALVVGSTSPDLLYAFAGWPGRPLTHDPWGLVWFCVPATLLLSRVIRLVAPIVAGHLPDGPPFALGDYGVLGTVRHRWYVTLWSAALGAASHIGWDAFTHRPGNGMVHAPIPALEATVAGLPVWSWLQHTSTVVGAAGTVALAALIGRRRLVRRWHGPPPVAALRPAVFWTVFGTVLAGCLAVLPTLPYAWYRFALGVRLLYAVGVALIAAAAAVECTRRWPLTGRTNRAVTVTSDVVSRVERRSR